MRPDQKQEIIELTQDSRDAIQTTVRDYMVQQTAHIMHSEEDESERDKVIKAIQDIYEAPDFASGMVDALYSPFSEEELDSVIAVLRMPGLSLLQTQEFQMRMLNWQGSLQARLMKVLEEILD